MSILLGLFVLGICLLVGLTFYTQVVDPLRKGEELFPVMKSWKTPKQETCEHACESHEEIIPECTAGLNDLNQKKAKLTREKTVRAVRRNNLTKE